MPECQGSNLPLPPGSHMTLKKSADLTVPQLESEWQVSREDIRMLVNIYKHLALPLMHRKHCI